jgi:TonB family protein
LRYFLRLALALHGNEWGLLRPEEESVSTTSSKTLLVTLLLSALLGTVSAQDKRSIKQRGNPAYPELAKKMNVQGTVKVEVMVAANGSVKSAKALGGHPLLIDAAVNAAKQMKFEPAPAETREEIPFNFTLNN